MNKKVIYIFVYFSKVTKMMTNDFYIGGVLPTDGWLTVKVNELSHV